MIFQIMNLRQIYLFDSQSATDMLVLQSKKNKNIRVNTYH